MLMFNDETAPYQLAFEAFGVELRVCVNEPELLDRIGPILPPGWRKRPNTKQYALGFMVEPNGNYLVFKETVCISEGHPFEYSLTMLESQIRGHIAVLAPNRTFIHAGAVAHEGRAIIVPGHSFSGKTTMTEAFVRAGATYYSDEHAVLDNHGLVHPYPKPLSIRAGEGRRQTDHSVESLDGVAGVDPVPLGAVLVTRYDPAAEWAPRELSPGEAALAVLSHTVTARSRPDEALPAIRRAVEHALTLEGPRGEASELAPRLLEQLSREPARRAS
jgi:hypothetical protein